jgi:hypothetical protein
MSEMNFEGMANGYNKDEGLSGEFSTRPAAAMGEIKSTLGPVKEILNHPDLAVLVGESKITQMMEHDLGEGLRLGDSKTIRAALAEAAQKIEHRRSQLYGETPLHGRQMVSRDQEMAFRREALTIIQTAIMNGRSKFIQKTGIALPGW